MFRLFMSGFHCIAFLARCVFIDITRVELRDFYTLLLYRKTLFISSLATKLVYFNAYC